MAIVKMKRLALAAIRSQKDELLKKLTAMGCVQVAEIDSLIHGSEIEDLVKNESSKLTQYKSEHASLVHAVSLLDKYVPQKSSLLSAKPELEAEKFLDETGLAGAVKFAQQIEEYDDRIKRIFAEESREKGMIEAMAPWMDMPMELNCEGTEYAGVTFGTVPVKVSVDDVEHAVTAVTEEAELFRINADERQNYILIVCLKEKLPEVQEALRSFGYAASALTGIDRSPREYTRISEENLRNLASEKEKCVQAIKDEAVRRDSLKLSADIMWAKVSIAEAEEKLFGTESTVMMEGWVPAECEKNLDSALSKFDCAWETREPDESEYPQVPVKLKNNKFTNGLNMVTSMYSLPAYGTVDPNPLMAPFFILFFGLMMADMGYGILIVIAALVAMKKMKPKEGTLSFCQLLFWGGIATFLGGALTGGFFSDVPKQLYDIICASKGVEPVWQGLPKLFSPTEDAIVVLIGALILGVLHMNTGMVVSFIQKKKAGNLAGAIWEEGSQWALLVAGLIFAGQKTGILGFIPAPVATVLLIAAVAMLLFGAGRDAKGFGKITAAFSCIYNTATGWFGDILSYSRIMALMLAGGVIGQVFNTVAIMPMQNSGISILTVIVFIVIFLLGHAMNFGLNLLGCYVHDLRLQCLEFFGKFYTDGGKPFAPLSVKGKYINAKE